MRCIDLSLFVVMHGEGFDHSLEFRKAVFKGFLRSPQYNEGLAENSAVACATIGDGDEIIHL